MVLMEIYEAHSKNLLGSYGAHHPKHEKSCYKLLSERTMLSEIDLYSYEFYLSIYIKNYILLAVLYAIINDLKNLTSSIR